MNLILLQSSDFRDDGLAVLSDERARHIRKVLRAEPGKVLRVGLLDGALGKGTVLAIDKQRVCLECVLEENLPSKPRIDLLLAMPRPKVLKRLWAQLAALGVGRVVLLNAEKVERFYFDTHVLEPDFYNARLIEGLQQACCTYLPKVLVRQRFKPFVEDELAGLFGDSLKLLADPSGKKRLVDCVQTLEPSGRVVLAIGPEGGWTPYEIEMLKGLEFEVFSLGRRILRTDTACVGLLALMAEYLS